MRLQSGIYYQTRDGRQAFVGAISERACGTDACVGWVEEKATSWTIEGYYFADMVPHDLDLIDKWHTPKRSEPIDLA